MHLKNYHGNVIVGACQVNSNIAKILEIGSGGVIITPDIVEEVEGQSILYYSIPFISLKPPH